ncbi:MAG: class I SAM-dependent methyltransferase [Deinococcales bacterium]
MAGDPLAETQRRVREQFGAAADAYVASATHAKGAELPRLVEVVRARLGEIRGRRALDVATGGGHTARALAEAGALVTVSDLTPEMLAAAETHLRGALPDAQLTFVAAAAEALPFEDGAFDLVTCRIAAHHFGDPRAFLAEVARVLRPGGVFLLVDNIAPEDARLAEAMNEIERLRDPSHVRAYRLSDWVSWAGEAGLEPFLLERFWRSKELGSWLRRANTAEENERLLRERLEAASEPVRRYLLAPPEAGDGTDVRPAPGADLHLRHEVLLLAAAAGPY